jgi:hypothetical protein
MEKGSNKTYKFKKFYLDGMSLNQQARALRSIDILLTAKGSGEVNIAWMRPCSIVLEISPWSYYIPHYFYKLSRRSGLLHYSWQALKEDTRTTDLFLNRPECERKLRAIEFKNHGNTTSMNKECLNDPLCSSCGQNVDGVIVNINDVQSLVEKAFEDRRRCISNHPFLMQVHQTTPPLPGKMKKDLLTTTNNSNSSTTSQQK